MKITFGLVVYQAEDSMRKCLDSIKDIADEIIVVHDGPCTDNSVTIAREYTPHVVIAERLGGSDPHRIYILKQSKNDWVFMIDSDEFLSDNLKNFLKNLSEDQINSYGALAFKWPLWNGERYVTFNNYRPCFFDRRKCWAIALHNFSIQTTHPIKKFDYVLEHHPKTNKVGLKLIFTTLSHRIKRDAQQFVKGYAYLEKYHEQMIPLKFKTWFSQLLKHPVFYAFFNGLKYFLGSYKNVYKDGKYGFIVSLQLAFYQYKLAWTIWQLKKTLKSHS